MSKLYLLVLKMIRRRPLCILLTSALVLCSNNGYTSHAFSPASKNTRNRVLVSRYRNGSSSEKLSISKTILSAHPLLQLATGASSMAPNSLLLMKDVSGPLSSILSADPDAEAQFLLDVSHIFLDFTAFFKFDGRFLNYAQLLGRISFILIDFLPGHAFHAEEMAIQLFFLGINLQKILQTDSESTSTLQDFISPDEIERQQKLHTCSLLPGEPIAAKNDHHTIRKDEEQEEEEMMVQEQWEEIEPKVHKRNL